MTENQIFNKWAKKRLKEYIQEKESNILRIKNAINDVKSYDTDRLRWKFCPLEFDKIKGFYEAHIGSSIYDCNEFAKYLAKSLNKRIEFEFNGKMYWAKPDGESKEINLNYDH